MTPIESAQGLDDLMRREWLAVNHVGGYASSTVPSLNTRKYHGLLVAAMPPPVHRMVLLSRVEEVVHCDGWPTALACNEYPGKIHPEGHETLRAFAPEPFPRWAYQGDGWSIEKSLQLLRGQNTVVLTYTLLGKKSVDLELRPLLALRPIHELTYQWNGQLDAAEKSPGQWRVPPTSRTPEVFFAHDGEFDPTSVWYFNTIYRREQDRGYAGLEDLWCPGVVKWVKLSPGQSVHFVCSTDPIDMEQALASAEMQCAQIDAGPILKMPIDTDHDLLIRSANRFVLDLPLETIEKTGVVAISKFPWGAPSVRDTLIGLPGLLLVTGKFPAAKAYLTGLAGRIRNGMVPTEFPEDGSDPIYNGADTSLWFVNAVWQYLRYSADDAGAVRLLDAVIQIVDTYKKGTELGIAADKSGLLSSRCTGQGTTWMDAKIGDWVVTLRAGKAVELNALWYNAIRIAGELSDRFGKAARAREFEKLAASIRRSFNAKFWNEREACCFDCVDENASDASIRPNQLLAISLPFAVLAEERQLAALDRVRRDLLTPFGPRTLSPGEPAYQGRYAGDVVGRDRACHQGSVHPWLLGAFVTAHIRVFGRGEKSRNDARDLLQACVDHIRNDGLGHLCELFDGDAPHRPGGAIASAAGVGELLRCYVEDILDQNPDQKSATARPAELPITIIPKAGSKR